MVVMFKDSKRWETANRENAIRPFASGQYREGMRPIHMKGSNIRPCDGLTRSLGKSPKEGQDERGTLKQLGPVFANAFTPQDEPIIFTAVYCRAA